MKFTLGDETDKALCIALKHEFLRCDEAFKQFASAGEALIVQGQDRRRAYKAYDAYSRFVHHLYEFALCAIARERHDVSTLHAVDADKYIASFLHRSLRKRRDAILDGTAPSWENHISAFSESIPPTLPEEFRRARNIGVAHAGIKRPKPEHVRVLRSLPQIPAHLLQRCAELVGPGDGRIPRP